MMHVHLDTLHGRIYISIMIMMVVMIHMRIVMTIMMELTIEMITALKALFYGYLVLLQIKMETVVTT